MKVHIRSTTQLGVTDTGLAFTWCGFWKKRNLVVAVNAWQNYAERCQLCERLYNGERTPPIAPKRKGWLHTDEFKQFAEELVRSRRKRTDGL